MSYTGNRSLSVSSSSNIDSTNPGSGVLSNYAANIRMVGLQGNCSQVGNFSYSYSVNAGATYSTIKWREAAIGTTPTSYQYEVRRNDTLPPGSANPHASGTSTTNSASYYVYSGDDYRIYVRPVCGTGVYGPWVSYQGGDCTVYDMPYLIDFQGSNNFPPCTRTYYGTQDYSGIPWAVTNNSGSNKLYYCSGIDPADAYFETPYILLEKDSTYSFSYDWNGNTDDYFYSNLWGRIPSWGSGTQELEYTSPTKTYERMQFHAFTSGGMGGCIYIDNLKVKRTSCGKPRNVKLTNLTPNAATINWQSPSLGISSSYTFTYNGSTISGIVDTSITLTGLTPGTVYYYTLKTTCSPGNMSTTFTGTFTTPCLPVNVPYNQDFETAVLPVIPACTGIETSVAGRNWVSYSAANGFTGKVLNYSNYTTASDAWFYTGGLNLVAGTAYRLTFKYGKQGSSYTDKLEVKFGAQPLSNAMTNLLASYTVNSTTPSTSTMIFTPAASGVYYIGFHANSPTANSGMYLDDISVTKYNLLNVSLFVDKNGNATQEAGEPYFDDANIITGKTGANPIVTHTSSGQCRVDIDTGNYITTITPYRPYYTVVPASHTSNFATYLNLDTAIFALQPVGGKRDLSVALFSYSAARPGFDIAYQLICKNRGTDTVSSSVLSFVKPHLLNFINSTTPPISVVGDTVTWNVTNLKPDDIKIIGINLSIPPPPVVNAGDYIFCTANISSGLTDLYPQDNNIYHSQLVTGSYDPNDKTESHGGSIKLSEIQNEGYLQYMIRFQNTGNDTAFNVSVRDSLSPLVDYNSLEMVAASADYKLVINDGDKLQWTFSNINLVDSNTNESASHGYIVYRVKPKATVSIGNIITNSASVYFDYNLPVRTNTDSCLVTADVFPLNLLSFTARKKEKTNELNWTTAQAVNVDRFEIERSAASSDFSKIGTVKNTVVGSAGRYAFVDNSPLSPRNNYRLKIMDKDGKFTYSPVRTIDNAGTFSISLQPNPSKNDFTMQVHGQSNAPLQIRITDVNGKIVGQLKNKAEQTFTFGSEWAPGVYLIECRQGDEIETIKAIKVK